MLENTCAFLPHRNTVEGEPDNIFLLPINHLPPDKPDNEGALLCVVAKMHGCFQASIFDICSTSRAYYLQVQRPPLRQLCLQCLHLLCAWLHRCCSNSTRKAAPELPICSGMQAPLLSFFKSKKRGWAAGWWDVVRLGLGSGTSCSSDASKTLCDLTVHAGSSAVVVTCETKYLCCRELPLSSVFVVGQAHSFVTEVRNGTMCGCSQSWSQSAYDPLIACNPWLTSAHAVLYTLQRLQLQEHALGWCTLSWYAW